MPPLVTIVGRPNVGKSTLFNRLTRSRRAIVDGSPGITRDRLYGEMELEGGVVRLADTGGLDLADDDALIAGVRDQALSAVNEADLLALMVDVRAGLTPPDRELAAHLRRYGKPLLLVLNKVDSAAQEFHCAEFHELGIADTVAVSAEHGHGIATLVDRVQELLPAASEEHREEPPGMRVAIVGRPNVGKSSLLNAIIGEGRMLVDELAGTTRDIVDVGVEVGGRRYTFLDTAGVRRKSSITARVEAVGSIKARRSIGAADCCILVIDAAQGLTAQDKALGAQIDRDGAGAIVAANKWDLVPSGENGGGEGDRVLRRLREGFTVLRYAPLVTTCAISGLRVHRVVEQLERIAEIQERNISTADLGRFLEALQARNPPPAHRGKQARIFAATQTGNAPARFRLIIRNAVPDNYLRFLENGLRREFDFEGVPIRFVISHR